MPNWVRNQVTITGDPEKVEALKKQVGASTQIPGVEYVKDSEGKMVKNEDGTDWLTTPITHSEDSPIFSFWNVIQPTKDEYESYANQGWYDWNVANWGCKWDANDIEEVDDSAGHWHVSFDTPWASPTEVFQALSLQHPDVTICAEWTEEQGYGAEEVFQEGSYSTIREWDIPQSHEDYEEVFGEGGCYCSYAGDDEENYPFDDCPRSGDDTRVAVAELEKVSELI